MIMKKNNIFRLFAALVLGSAMFIVSCNDSGTEQIKKEDPSFPELIENYDVQPGETLVLTFTPNYDWSVSVPAEMRQWFWIQDGSFSVSEVSGKASETAVVVNIGVTENQEFDKNFSCEVSLTMDGQTQVIAKYMLPAKERTMSFYAAEWNEDGSLKLAEDGVSYVYAAAEPEKLELKWSAADAEFRAPVKVEANCEWTVEMPEWAEVNVPESTTGVVELVFSGESLEAASGKLVFKAGEDVLKEVAVSVPSCNSIEVYTAKMAEGEFEYGENGEYAWSDNAVESVELAWLGADFRMPVMVDAKCDWDVVLPDWVTAEVPEKTTGQVSLVLRGVPSKYPLEDTKGKVTFKLGDNVLKELEIMIPGCQDIMTFSIDMSLAELEYNYIGEINTSTGYIEVPATGHLFGVKDVRVFAVETTGGKVGAENPDWFTIEMTGWNTASGADVLQERTLTFRVTENAGDARSAVLFFLPPSIKSKAEELFNADASVKEEYSSYAVAVSQGSMNYDEYLTVHENPDAEFDYSFEKASSDKASQLAALYGATDFVYVLTYESPYCRDDAYLTMAVPFASYKVFAEGEWLAYTNAGEANNYGVIDMYRELELPTEPVVGHVVFYNSASEVLAIVECVSPFKEEVIVTPPEDLGDVITDEYGNEFIRIDSYFTDPEAAKAAGIKLYECVKGTYYDQYMEFECPILMLEYDSLDDVAELTLPVPVKNWFAYLNTYSDYVTVNNETYYDTAGFLAAATDKISIRMLQGLYDLREEIEAGGGKNAGFKLAFHKTMSTQNPSIVIFCRLNLAE